MAENETISRAELATRLGIPEADLLTRKEAAAVIGIEQSTLSNRKDNGPAFYRSNKSATGGLAWYPRATVEQYARHLATKAKRSFAGPVGQLEWPISSRAAGGGAPVHLVVEMIQKWKRRELYRRAQKVLNEPFADDEEFKDELRMFGEPWPEARMEALGRVAEDPDLPARPPENVGCRVLAASS